MLQRNAISKQKNSVDICVFNFRFIVFKNIKAFPNWIHA